MEEITLQVPSFDPPFGNFDYSFSADRQDS